MEYCDRIIQSSMGYILKIFFKKGVRGNNGLTHCQKENTNTNENQCYDAMCWLTIAVNSS